MALDLDDFSSGLKEGLFNRKKAKQDKQLALVKAMLGKENVTLDTPDNSFNIGGIPLRKMSAKERAELKLAEDPLASFKASKMQAQTDQLRKRIELIQRQTELAGRGKPLSIEKQLEIGGPLSELGLSPQVTQQVLNIINQNPAAGQALLRDVQSVTPPTLSGNPLSGLKNLFTAPSVLGKQLGAFGQRFKQGLPIFGDDESIIKQLIRQSGFSDQNTRDNTSAEDISNLLAQLDDLEASLDEE